MVARSSVRTQPLRVAIGAWAVKGTMPTVPVVRVSCDVLALCAHGGRRGDLCAQRGLADEDGDVAAGFVEDRLAAEAGGDHAADLFVAGAGLSGAAGKMQQLAGVVGYLEDSEDEQGS
jgi:hypothetical protein